MTPIAHRRAVARVRAERSLHRTDSRQAASSAVPEYDTVWEGVGAHRRRPRPGALDSLDQDPAEALSLAFGGYTKVVAQRGPAVGNPSRPASGTV